MSERIWTAALVVIGDEILSGRTQDRNVAQIAAWLNVLLVTEHSGRGLVRSFVRFEDLLSDWRAELGRIAAQLGVPVAVGAGPHELDEWLEPQLRTPMAWDDIAVPASLRDLAEQAWAAPAQREHRRRTSTKLLGYLTSTGILVKEPVDAF